MDIWKITGVGGKGLREISLHICIYANLPNWGGGKRGLRELKIGFVVCLRFQGECMRSIAS